MACTRANVHVCVCICERARVTKIHCLPRHTSRSCCTHNIKLVFFFFLHATACHHIQRTLFYLIMISFKFTFYFKLITKMSDLIVPRYLFETLYKRISAKPYIGHTAVCSNAITKAITVSIPTNYEIENICWPCDWATDTEKFCIHHQLNKLNSPKLSIFDSIKLDLFKGNTIL